MTLLAPVLIVLAVVIPAKLAMEGVRLRIIAIGCAGLGAVGVFMFLNGINSADPQAAAAGDPGRIGKVGILFLISGLIGGITLAVTGIIRTLSGASKG